MRILNLYLLPSGAGVLRLFGPISQPPFRHRFWGSLGPGLAPSGTRLGWLLGSAGDLRDSVSTSAGGVRAQV